MRILIAKNIVYSYLLSAKSARGILSIYLLNKIKREPYLQGFLTESTFQDILKTIEELTASKTQRDKLTALIKEALHLLPTPVLSVSGAEGALSQFREVESEEIASALQNSLDALVTHEPARYKLANDLLVLTVGEFLDQYRRSKLNRGYLAGSVEVAACAPSESSVLVSHNRFGFSVSQILIKHLVQELEAAVHTERYSSPLDEKVIFGNEYCLFNTQPSQHYENDPLLSTAEIHRRLEPTPIESGNTVTSTDKTPKFSRQSSHPRTTFLRTRYEEFRVELRENMTLVLMVFLVAVGLQYLNQPELVATLKQSGLQEDNLLRSSDLATVPVNSAFALSFGQLLQQAKSDLLELAALYADSEIPGEVDRSFMQLPISLVADLAEIVEGFVEDVYLRTLDRGTEISDVNLNELSEIFAAVSKSRSWDGKLLTGEAQNQSSNLHQRAINSEAERSRLDRSSDKNTLLADQSAADRFIENGLTRFFQVSRSELSEPASQSSELSEPASQSEYSAQSNYSAPGYSDIDQNNSSEVNFYDSRNTFYDNLPKSEYGELPTYDSVTSPSENHLKVASSETAPFDDFSTVMGSGLVDSRFPTNDYVRGQRTNDTLLSGDGNDILNGDRGFDILTGGRGADTFITGYGVATITDFSAAEGDRLDILGTVKDYNLIQRGSDTVVRVKSQTVARFLDVPVGQVVAIVENTASQDLRFITKTIKDPVIGSAAKDIIGGDMGNYQFFGGGGNDVLIGRDGSAIAEFNLLTGGKGADIFNIGSHGAGGFSTITDFNSKQGDKIVLEGDPNFYAFEVVGSHTEIRRSKFMPLSYQLVAVVQNKQDLNLADFSFLPLPE